MLNEGRVDGDAARVYSFGEHYPNVIRVEEPVGWASFVAYANDPTIRLDGWKSLKGTAYRVAYARGAHICEVRLPEVVNPENLFTVTRWLQGLKMLQAGRIDIFIAAENDILLMLESDEYKDFDIRKVGVMEQVFAHPYFLKKHRNLAQKFEAILKAMAEEGLIKAYRAKAFGE